MPRTSLEIQAAAEAELVIQAELQAIQLAISYSFCRPRMSCYVQAHSCLQPSSTSIKHISWRLRLLISKIHRNTLNTICTFKKISRSSNSRAHVLATTAKLAINTGLGDDLSLTFSCAHQNDGRTHIQRIRDCPAGPCRLINITCTVDY